MNGQWYLPIEFTCRYASRSYTLRAANQPQSALAPWQSAGDTGDSKTRGVISPTPGDENKSPSQSPRSSQHPSKSFSQTHETLATPGSTFNVVFPTTSYSSGGSSSDTRSNEHHRVSNLGNSDRDHLASIIYGIRAATLGRDTLTTDVDQNMQPVNGALDYPLSSGDRLMEPFHGTCRPDPCTGGY